MNAISGDRMRPLGRPPKQAQPDRVCREPGCTIVLSRYNTAPACRLHTPPKFGRVRGRPKPSIRELQAAANRDRDRMNARPPVSAASAAQTAAPQPQMDSDTRRRRKRQPGAAHGWQMTLPGLTDGRQGRL